MEIAPDVLFFNFSLEKGEENQLSIYAGNKPGESSCGSKILSTSTEVSYPFGAWKFWGEADICAIFQ